MGLVSFLFSDHVPNTVLIPALFGTALFLSYILPYLLSNTTLRVIPGPFAAKFSNLWLMLQARRGKRYLSVDNAHKKYGKFVRIQPHHVSIADETAIPIIYGHGNGFLKSEYYNVFVSIRPAIFSTRDRVEHTRKRKLVAHTFSARSVGQFEQYIHANLEALISQWNRLSDEAQTSKSKHLEYAEIDSLHWFNYLAFDIIGDLAFGRPFGMLEAGADRAASRSYTDANAPTVYVPAVQVLNRRGEVNGALGAYPQLKPYAKYLPDPFFSQGLEAVEKLAGISVAAVKTRLDIERSTGQKNTRVDLLQRLMEGKDESGEPMGETEVTAEAQNHFVAGSDTTSNTACAFFYWATRTPGVYDKLRTEIDNAMKNNKQTQRDLIPEYASINDLPYLWACINETLRIHSTSSLGLPRIVTPAAGVTVCGTHFPQGTVLSVPSYTMHHSTSIWGSDADSFRPERWDPDVLTEQQKSAFIPFSTGPRACVGRNVAEMELALIAATVVRGFDLDLRQEVLETREGFLRKPLACLMGVRRRAQW